MSFLADIRGRAQAANRDVHAAAKDERRARTLFEDGKLSFDQMREAIRRSALAEQRAIDLGLVVVVLERLNASEAQA
jgi:hypothetical protein